MKAGTLLGCALGAVLLMAGCQTPDPRVPKRMNLFPIRPVMAARFEATAQGYALETYRALALPTESLTLNRAVQIVSLDESNRPITRISVENPRVAVSADSGPHVRRELGSSSFTVFLDRLDEIRALSLEVVRGPNAGLTNVFPVNPASLKPWPGGTNVIQLGPGTEPPARVLGRD